MESDNRADLILYVQKLKIDGLEIGLARRENLFNISFTNKQIEYLKELKYVSLHMPVNAVKDCSEEEIIEGLDKIIELYNEVGAQCIVIHPDALPSEEILEKYRDKAKFVTENLDKAAGYGVEKLEKVFANYPYLGLCLDVCHSFTWDINNVGNLVDKFKERIFQIHISGIVDQVQHRQLLDSSENLINSLKPIKQLDVPFVIEEDVEELDFDKIQKEIDFVQEVSS